MNGAESLVRTLAAAGVDTCFANPGTSEMHLVVAMDRNPGLRCVLGLQENVVTGMADGYFRIARKPASALLHCGPGLSNGLGNLHNARRARSGIVNVIGDQATFHRPFDAPLTADTDSLARTVSSWVRTSARAADLGRDAADAVRVARTAPGQIASLIVPMDVSWSEGGVVGETGLAPSPPPLDPAAVEHAAALLRERGDTLLLLSGTATMAGPQALAWRIARATGASVLADYASATVQRGRGRPALGRMPYALDHAIRTLERFATIILVGARPPVGFYAYPGKPSVQHRPDCRLHVLTRPDQDAELALTQLADMVGGTAGETSEPALPSVASGEVTSASFAATLAALLPEDAIVSDESVTFGRDFYQHTHAAPPHDWLHLVGGAIGAGMPVATGAAVAAGGARRVVNLQADGSAMYSLQSLWTQARERLPVTTVMFANRRYRILIGEYMAIAPNPGPTAMGMFDLGNPDIDWVKSAESMGVEAARAGDMAQCADLLRQSFSQPGPFLIELATP